MFTKAFKTALKRSEVESYLGTKMFEFENGPIQESEDELSRSKRTEWIEKRLSQADIQGSFMLGIGLF